MRLIKITSKSWIDLNVATSPTSLPNLSLPNYKCVIRHEPDEYITKMYFDHGSNKSHNINREIKREVAQNGYTATSTVYSTTRLDLTFILCKPDRVEYQ